VGCTDLAADYKGYGPLPVMGGVGGDGVTLLPIIDAAYRLAIEIIVILVINCNNFAEKSQITFLKFERNVYFWALEF
jgi:hypothetical protein